MSRLPNLSTISAALAIAVAMPGGVNAQDKIDPPLPKLNLDQYVPAQATDPANVANRTILRLSASLTEDAEPLLQGVSWRVFSAEPQADGRLAIVAKTDQATPAFELQPGTYLVHAAFGRAGATKRISVDENGKTENFVINAGGIRLDATLQGGTAIPPFKLKFDVFDMVENIDGERQLIIGNVKPGAIIGLNAGLYHVVSTYGDLNAVIRSDIRVEAGKLTEASVEHRAAEAIIKLVAEPGGEALADTAWTIYTELGEVMVDIVGPYATAVLSEGTYTAVAKHRDRIVEKDFVIESGKNAEVELLLTDQAVSQSPDRS